MTTTGDHDVTLANLSWTVGDITITRVEESIAHVDATALIPDFTPGHLEPHRDWLVPAYFADNGKMRLSIHSFVVQTTSTVIVVDTCVGPDPQPLPNDPEFPDRLNDTIAGGLHAVDFVLCTHLHFDHVGWNLRPLGDRRVPTFPNARYLISQDELDFLDQDDHMNVREPSIQPLLDAGLIDAVATDHEITSEVRLVPTPGHTPGHVSVLIESQGEQALITGDMTHTPLQFAEPDLAAANFDWDSEQSSATRHRMISEYAGTQRLILGTHFAPPTAGYLTTDHRFVGDPST